MSKVDKRIVSMEFNDGQFQKGAQNSIKTLEKLKQSLNLDKAGQGLDNLQKTAGRFTLGGLESAANGVTAKFSALGVMAITALSNIANKAVDVGMRVAKSLTIEPVMEGFKEYETKIGSIQTILANTARHGTTLEQVTANLDDLNQYADKTIYNFGDMTKNIGLFTNAGIKVESATSMIKGFSNEAAASGTKAEDASRAAYQLSQAMSAGVVKLQDWKSLTNAGMGNANMRQGLIDIADALGFLEDSGTSAAEVQKDFNASLEKGWLSAGIMETYLNVMAESNGDVNREMLHSIGLQDDVIDRLIKQQKTSEEAATKVRTFTQLMDTLKEAVGSGWAQTFEILFGNFNEATELWTSVSDTLGPIIKSLSDSRNELLKTWAALGGRTALLQGFANIFKALGAAIAPIQKAFSSVFKAIKPETLVSASKAFEAFTAKLILSDSAAKKVEDGARKVFNVIKSIGVPIKAVVTLLGQLATGTGPSASKMMEGLSGAFSRLLSWGSKGAQAFSDWANSTDVFAKAGEVIGSALTFITNTISSIHGALSRNVFEPLASSAEASIGPVKSGFTSLSDTVSGILDKISSVVSSATASISGFFDSLGRGTAEVQKTTSSFQPLTAIMDFLKKAMDGVAKTFAKLGDAGITVGSVAGFIGKAFGFITSGALALGFMKLSSSVNKITENIAGITGAAEGVLNGVTGALKGMQQNLQAKALLNIALAVAVLTASLVVLSFIPAAKAAASIGIMTALIADLVGALAGITHFTKGAQVAEMNGVAVSMIIMAAAMSILAGAVKKIADLSAGQLAKGIIALEALTVVMATMSKILTKNAPQMQVASKSILRFSISIYSLAFAMKAIAKALEAFKATITLFGEMDTGVLIKGLIGLSATFAILMASIRAMPEQSEKASFAMLLMATSVKMVADVVERFGNMPLGQLIKGLFGMGVAMAAMAAALHLVPTDLGAKAGSLILAAIAMNILAGALSVIGSIEMGNLAKGLIGMTIALAAIAGGLYLMTGTIGGAVALTIAAVALTMLIPVLVALAALPAANIAKGLLALVGLFAAIGVAGLLLAPLVPVLIAVGAAMMFMGVALFLGAMAFASVVAAIAMFAGVGVVGIGLIVTAITALLTLLPLAGAMFGQAIIAMANAIGGGAPAIMSAIVAILTGVINAIKAIIPQVVELVGLLLDALLKILIENVPKLVEMIILLVDAILKVLVDAIPKIVEAALDILVALLESIRDHIGDVVTLAIDIVTEFVTALGSKLGDVAEAGVQLITDLLNAIGDTARNSGPELGEAGQNLVTGIVQGILGGLTEFWGPIVQGVKDMGTKIIDAFKQVLGIHSPSTVFMALMGDVGRGIINGIQNFVGAVVDKGRSMARSLIDGVKGFFAGNSSDTARNFINGVLSSIGKGISSVVNKAKSLARDVINGVKSFFSGNSGTSASTFISGIVASIGSGVNAVVNKAASLAGSAISGARDWFRNNSGNVGRALIDGIINGISRGVQSVRDAANRLARSALDSAKRTLGIASPSKEFAKIGGFVVEGFTGALDRGTSSVEDSSESLATASMDAVRKAFDDIVEFFDFDEAVVVTPTVDLSEAEKAADALRNLLTPDVRSSYPLSAVQNAADSRGGPSDGASVQPVGGGTTTYIQNNHSPKALSTSDIYRQTRNLVSRARS